MSRFSVEKFLPYKAEKIRMGTLSVSLLSRIVKFYASKGCHDFLSIFFVSQFRKKPLRNPSVLCFRTFPVTKKIMDKRGGVWRYQDFPSKVFRLRVPELLVGEIFCAVFRKVFGSEELYGVERRRIKIFRQIVFVSQCRKLSQRNHLCCVSEPFR